MRPAKLLTNPLLPIIAGALVAWFDAPGDVAFRSLFLLVCWFLLAIDLCFSVRELALKRQWKLVVAPAVISIAAIVMLFCVRSLYSRKLEEQLANVYQHIDVGISLPKNDDPLLTRITITNNSDYVVGAHTLDCQVHRLDAPGRYPGAGIQIEEVPFTRVVSRGRIGPHGDAESGFCLLFPIRSQTVTVACADVTLYFQYVLETQPSRLQEKEWRFVYLPEFGWTRQSHLNESIFCRK